MCVIDSVRCTTLIPPSIYLRAGYYVSLRYSNVYVLNILQLSYFLFVKKCTVISTECGRYNIKFSP